jgi:hypothetical protein
MLKFISFKVFIISFLIGLFFVYMIGTEHKKIIVYPTPQNIAKMCFDEMGCCQNEIKHFHQMTLET